MSIPARRGRPAPRTAGRGTLLFMATFLLVPAVPERPARGALPSDLPALGATEQQADTADSQEARSRSPFQVLPYAMGVHTLQGEYRSIRALVDTVSGSIQYQGDEGFLGTVELGLQDKDDPSLVYQLKEEVSFSLRATRGEWEPSEVSVAHTNRPFPEAKLRVPRTDAPSLEVRIRGPRPRGIRLEVPVEPPVELIAEQDDIPGWGLGTAELQLGVDPALRNEGVTVVLSADRGSLEPNRLRLDGDKELKVELRSTGLGTDTVTAHAVGVFPEVKKAVTYRFPFGFLLAALLGGLIGGVVSGLEQGRKGHWAILGFDAVEGLLVGLLVAVAFPLGINLLELTFEAQQGEALIFVLAGLGGVAGQVILERGLTLSERVVGQWLRPGGRGA